MKRTFLRLFFWIFLFSGLVLSGCQSSSDNDDSSTDPSSSTGVYTGIAVDPYIEGAIFCEDVNNNGSCDDGEQLSTASDADGVFQFNSAVTVGSTIIVQTQGTHNGVTYTLDIARTVDSSTDITDQVISPLTTLATRDLTNSQIAEMLQNGGLTSITADDVESDPMSGISSLSGTITEEQVVNIRSSIAVYALLKIISGSTTLEALSGTDLFYSATTSGQPVNEILTTMVTFVKGGLDPTIITAIQDQLDAAPIDLPVITAEDVTRTAVAITDFIAKTGYETCNATSGDAEAKVTAALTEVQSQTNDGASVGVWAAELGQRYYAIRNKETLTPYTAFLPADIKAGLNCTSETFVIDSSGSVTCYTE